MNEPNVNKELKPLDNISKALDKVKAHEKQFLNKSDNGQNDTIKKRMGMDLLK